MPQICGRIRKKMHKGAFISKYLHLYGMYPNNGWKGVISFNGDCMMTIQKKTRKTTTSVAEMKISSAVHNNLYFIRTAKQCEHWLTWNGLGQLLNKKAWHTIAQFTWLQV